MIQWMSMVRASPYFQHRWFQLVVSILIGLAFFLLAIWGLDRPTALLTTTERSPSTAATTESLSRAIPSNRVAVSTPVFGTQALMADVQIGDRMDIVALFPPRAEAPAQAAVVVRGATVLARPVGQSGAPIVFAVTPEESIVVTHLVQGGVSLTYSLWSTSGASPASPRS